jgi:hypothetical protein
MSSTVTGSVTFTLRVTLQCSRESLLLLTAGAAAVTHNSAAALRRGGEWLEERRGWF